MEEALWLICLSYSDGLDKMKESYEKLSLSILSSIFFKYLNDLCNQSEIASVLFSIGTKRSLEAPISPVEILIESRSLEERKDKNYIWLINQRTFVDASSIIRRKMLYGNEFWCLLRDFSICPEYLR